MEVFRLLVTLLVWTSSVSVAAILGSGVGVSDDNSQSEKNKERAPQIINGIAANVTDWPFMCLLEYQSSFRCGCVLVSRTRVLTAAHCVEHLSRSSDLTVLLGLQDRTRITQELDEGNAQRVSIQSIRTHFLYRSATLTNDLAVLRLPGNTELINGIRPVQSIAQASRPYWSNGDCYVLGYGIVGFDETRGGDIWATDLQEVNLQVITNQYCSTLIEGITRTKICAFNSAPLKASCFGDSGGPLVCKNEDENYTLVGITSYGNEKCSTASVFTRLSSYQGFLSRNGVS